MAKIQQYTVIRDTSEKKGWDFSPNGICLGTVNQNLFTGDYTIEGFEKRLIIERKGTSGELAQNLFEKRFMDELDRMDDFEFPFLILEFTNWEVNFFPQNSNIPRDIWPKLKMNPNLYMKYLNEIQFKHPRIKVLFAGNCGKDWANSIFKRMLEIK